MPGQAAAQICMQSTGGSTISADSTGDKDKEQKDKKPRKRRAPKEGTVEVAATGCETDRAAPTVSIDPSQGNYTAGTLPVTVYWSDNVGLDQYGWYITLNGVDVTAQFTYTGDIYSAQSTATITLQRGQNTLIAETWDQAGNHGTKPATYTYSVPLPSPAPLPEQTAGVSPGLREVVRGIYQQVLEREGDPGGLDSWTANLTNGWTVRQMVQAFATSQEYRDRFITPYDERTALALLYRHLLAREPDPGAWGYLDMARTQGWNTVVSSLSNSAEYAEYFGDHAVPGRPVSLWDPRRAALVLEPQTGNADQDRELCLTVAVEGGAYECGDLRLAHALPAVRTLNKVRAPVLLYNSQHAHPTPIVGARVTLPSDRGQPERVDAVLHAGPRSNQLAERARRGWAGHEWAVGQPVRIALSYDASGDVFTDGLGIVEYVLEVTATYPGGSAQTWRMRGTRGMVNRRGKAFGDGWWLAGLEQVRCIDCGSWTRMLWVGGDGSTRVYEPMHNDGTAWVARTPDRGMDTLRIVSDYAGARYMRRLPGGIRVYYDASGNHMGTVNRLDHHTHFVWDGPRLASLWVPAQAGYYAHKATYRFNYGSGGDAGRLYSVTAPDVNNQAARTMVVGPHNGDSRVWALHDPDGSYVELAYWDPARPSAVMRRQDRRRASWGAHYFYGGGGLLEKVNFDMGGDGEADDLITRLTPAENRGLAGAPVPMGDVLTLLNGPRDDATDAPDGRPDHTRFWLTRHGAPWRMVDALSRETLLTRSDLRFPALVTRTDGPFRADGRRQTVSAQYDARGNLLAETDWSTLRAVNGSTVYSTTRYEYGDAAWPDFVTRATMPEGEVTRIGYHPNGSRAWQQPGDDQTRRVRFDYNAPGLLEYVWLPVVGSERIEYDTWGNLHATTTPRGARIVHHNDALGRTWKTESPIDGTSIATTQTTYDGADRVKTSVTSAPMLSGPDPNAVQIVTVENWYDAEGNLRRLSRRSDGPDINSVGWITTRWEYDPAGRRVAEWAPDATPADSLDNPVDRTFYDFAGNVREVHTRRRDPSGLPLKISMEYDALSRLRRRETPAVLYNARDEGIPRHYRTTSYAHCDGAMMDRTYPGRPNSGCGYQIAADVQTFAYDELGNLVRADNADARIRRAYNLDGTLRLDTLRIRTTDGADFSRHQYVLSYEYDLNGRRTLITHPAQLAPAAGQNTTRYGYDPVTGGLQKVTDPMGNVFVHEYNQRGEMHRRTFVGGATDDFRFDTDGALSGHATWGDAGELWRNTRVERSIAGRVLQVRNSAGRRDTVRIAYSGLGHAASTLADIYHDTSTEQLFDGSETFQFDALGNVYSQKMLDTTLVFGTTQVRYTERYSNYESGSGRLTHVQTWAPRRRGDDFRYDRAGNLEFSTQTYNAGGSCDAEPRAEADCEDRASFYAADERLRAAEHRSRLGSDNGDWWQSTFEEYRYDALGRRVWVRSRMDCPAGNNSAWPWVPCFSSVRRTVWDGEQEIWEIQMPGQDGSPYLENDTDPLPIQPYVGVWPTGLAHCVWDPSKYSRFDPNPHYGRVGYTYGQGVDQPLSLVRVGLNRYYPGPTVCDAGEGSPFAAFSAVPLWDWRGHADGAVYPGGARQHCQMFASGSRCVRAVQANSWRAFDQSGTDASQWYGTVVGGKRDATGTLYRRARYYDPQTGRFTQEDPIGLAGGLNLYGYAGSDPVNYADPSGQIAVPLVTGLVGGVIGGAIGGYKYGWKGAALGFVAGGVAGAGAGAVAVRLGLLPATILARSAAPTALGAGGQIGQAQVVTAAGQAASVQASAATAATLIPPAGHKMAQMIARWGGTGGASGFMNYAEEFVANARTAGTVVVGQIGSGANAITNGVIYRVGNSYLATDAAGKLMSYVHSAEAGKGIVLEYLKLGGRL